MEYPEGFSELFVQRINTIQNNFSYCWFVYVAILDPSIINQFEKVNTLTIDDTYELSFLELISEVMKDPQKNANEFMHFHLRGIFIILYEAFKNDQIRYKAVSHENWFEFLWLLRNSMAHGIEADWGEIYPNRGDSFVYKRLSDGQEFILHKSLKGSPVDFKQFGGYVSCIDLLKQAKNFATEQCKKNS
jgi:hypothetical protein